MVGTIMADQSISFATRAALSGRALARIGAVTLDTTSIVIP
jgi:type VI secretion system secreted protein VgrG